MTATLAAAPSQQHPRSRAPEPLWGLRLHGVPCDVCQRPAAGMTVYPTGRLIHHHGWKPCVLPNPPRVVPDYRDAT